ncbi:signal transduction histidine kinase [Sediminihabitans luteus]|uniref:histidine kinase n=1 Tax=Sediminihabitans luteus TaxID=1138585 RepID=A0A2M9D0S8_9CELL|nr:sensor histidine kinase [Sediminihabitans luteus]PJJ77760.1 signal transduction histidine kinase [Sediminihabitans luteus]GIJ00013.1 histidine kinase [Sediminihabitans luteus]
MTTAARAVWRGTLLAGRAILEILVLAWALVVVVLSFLGVGILLAPGALAAVRGDARWQRRHALRWSGVEVTEAYGPQPVRTPGFRGAARWSWTALRDGATWRDLGWHLADPVVGLAIALLPLALVANGVWGVVLLGLWEPAATWDGNWYLFVPLTSQTAAGIAAVLGVVQVVCGFAAAAWFVRLHARWVRAVLGHRARDLERRVEHLARSRADAVDHQASEVRRIERDLHDGAQARIVATGMTLAAAERLLDTDPEAARALLQDARATSSAALQELRDLVRGIHPPVLADRGLVDAVRSQAVATGLDVDVVGALDARPLPSVESAAYFAVAELLANVAKHAGVGAASVDVTRDGADLVVVVSDDGTGGADATRGTGLAGVARRLAAFDGTLDLVSPAGGPTRATVRVPAAWPSDG